MADARWEGLGRPPRGRLGFRRGGGAPAPGPVARRLRVRSDLHPAGMAGDPLRGGALPGPCGGVRRGVLGPDPGWAGEEEPSRATAATPGGFLAKSLLSWAFLSPYLCASVALAASFLVFLATCRRLSYEPYSYSVGRVAASALVFEAAFVPGVPLVVLAMSLL